LVKIAFTFLGETMKKLFLLVFLAATPLWATVPAEDYYNAGIGLFQQKDYERAIEYFHASIQEKPDFWQAYQFLGEAYYQNSNRTEAVVAMKESLRLHSDNPELRKFLGMVESNSPWVPTWSWRDWLIIFSFIFSTLSLGWVLYSNRSTFPAFKKTQHH
jgi:tetratricopeptide (TPR) repeat protein